MFCWNCGLSSVIWKLSSGRHSPSPPMARPRVVCFHCSCHKTGNRVGRVLAGMLSMITDEHKFSSPLPGFLRRKVRKRAAWGPASKEYFFPLISLFSSKELVPCPGSAVNSLCLSPGPLLSPCCWQLTLNFFCNSLSARWLVRFQTCWGYFHPSHPHLLDLSAAWRVWGKAL